MNRRPLIVEKDGARVRLLAPNVGWFSRGAAKGQLLAPEASAGVLETLGTFVELVVPAGVLGRIVNAAPVRFQEPVEYGQVLYELEPLDGALALADVQTSTAASGLVVRAPFAGRFWQRPSPADPLFVAQGEELSPGRTIGLLEVMKTFSHVHYGGASDGLPERARVARFAAADGAEVSAGDALLVVEAP
jgi:biotin carboxyl carrier protein